MRERWAGGVAMKSDPVRRGRRACGHRGAARGQGLLEFALIVPLLVLLIFGSIDTSRAVSAYIALSQMAREAARYSVVHAGEPGATACTYDTTKNPPDALASSACGPLIRAALMTVPQLDPTHLATFALQYGHYGTGDGSGGTLNAQIDVTYRFSPLSGVLVGGASITLAAHAIALQQ